MLIVPELLKIPDKLDPIISELDNYRYFLIEGGRGGGKSQAVGRFILYLAEQYNIRVVCGREIQNSIAESVYSLLTDLVNKHTLNFEVFASKLVHKKTGTTINFRGFREQGAFNIQGMEGIDIVWIDEAQAITKETLDVLIPTIRKDNAKIFFTMNRYVHNDPVYDTFVKRKDCLHIHINYDDNPFCTEALKTEALECKARSEDDYNHIWLGLPVRQAENSVFGHEELWGTKSNKYPLKEGYGLKLAGFDVARYGDDKCAIVVLQQMGALHWEEVYSDTWDHKDLNFTTGQIMTLANEQRVEKSVIDEDGIGAGPLDTLNHGRNLQNFVGFRNGKLDFDKNKFYANPRTVNTYKLKEMILKGHIYINNEELLRELENAFRYTYDSYQRKILVSKEQMRAKYNIKSPNLADALIMAVSLIGEFHYKQDIQYYRQPQYAKEDNLFSLGGIR